MHILYCLSWRFSESDGVSKKVRIQTDLWRSQGHTVSVFCNGDASSLPGQNVSVSVSRWANRTRIWPGLIGAVNERKPDLAYLRYSTSTPTTRWLASNVPSVAEINSDIWGEMKAVMTKHPLLGLLNLLSSKAFEFTNLSEMAGIVAPTLELAEQPYIDPGAPIAVIGNGCKFSGIVAQPARPLGPPNLFFIGSSGLPWHGIDLILGLAKLLPDFQFHVVGADGLESTDNVRSYGTLSSKEYLPILHQCHVCIGTLALFRKGMTQAVPLKVREYLAHGFPTIIGYEEDLRLMNKPFILRVDTSNGVNEQDAESIRHFTSQMRNYVVPRSEIEFLGWAEIERIRTSFLVECLESHRKVR